MESIFNYGEAIKYIDEIPKFTKKNTLEHTRDFLDSLDINQNKMKIIHVAGTNGKGSVCAMISNVLYKAEKNIGLFTSPHLVKVNERVKINNEIITDEEFAKAFNKVKNKVTEMERKGYPHPSYFEFLFLMAMSIFNEKNVEYVVLETGLGGRFDATNVIKSNLCSIITHIDLDHTERLGKTRSEIAFEKAGIIKPNCPVLTCEGYEEIKDTADEKESLFLIVTPFSDTTHLSLKGNYQGENLALALNCIQLLFKNIPQETINSALRKVKHPCRFEYIEKYNLIIDGAHNPNGAMALRESLDYKYYSTPRRFVFGCLKNKDYEQMMQILFEPDDEIYFYHFDNPNSCTIEELQTKCPYPAKNYTGKEILMPDKLNIICGSFYMINELVTKNYQLR